MLFLYATALQHVKYATQEWFGVMAYNSLYPNYSCIYTPPWNDHRLRHLSDRTDDSATSIWKDLISTQKGIVQKDKKKYDKYTEHGNHALSVFQAYAKTKTAGIKFHPELDIGAIPKGGRIFGFSYGVASTMRQRIEQCAQKGIVVIAAGNEGKKNVLFDQRFRGLRAAVENNSSRVIVVGSHHPKANYLTMKGINFVRAPFMYDKGTYRACLKGRRVILGSSLGQPYVAALLYRSMQQAKGLPLEDYVDALMHYHNQKGHLYNFEDALVQMTRYLK